MAILVDANTRVVIQGMTGTQGTRTAESMLKSGTRVLAGITPGKGGQSVTGIPVYNSVAEAVANHPEINASLILVPGRFVEEAAMEAAEAGIPLIVIGSEAVPFWSMLKIIRYCRLKNITLVGPDSLGVFSPGLCKIGSHVDAFFVPGPVGIVAKGGTATLQIARQLKARGIGISTVVNLGGAKLRGCTYTDILPLFDTDPQTKVVVLVGEIGGMEEAEAARVSMTKPIIGFLLGKSAPLNKQMGHVGAITEYGMGSWEQKYRALTEAGMPVAKSLDELVERVNETLGCRQTI